MSATAVGTSTLCPTAEGVGRRRRRAVDFPLSLDSGAEVRTGQSVGGRVRLRLVGGRLTGDVRVTVGSQHVLY